MHRLFLWRRERDFTARPFPLWLRLYRYLLANRGRSVSGTCHPSPLFVRLRQARSTEPRGDSNPCFNIKIDSTRRCCLFLWRREGDLNPRTGITRLLVFEASPFSLLGTSPQIISRILATNKGQKPQPETKPKTGAEASAGYREGHYSIGLWCTQVVASDTTMRLVTYPCPYHASQLALQLSFCAF